MSSKDMSQFIRNLRGAEATLGRNGHWKIKTPTGQMIVCPGTPRNPSRCIKNTRAMLRRNGVAA